MKKTIIAIIIMFISMPAQAFDIKQLFLDMRERLDSRQDYSCTLEDFQANKNKSVYRIHNYYYKKPGMIRMEIVDGEDIGTILVYKDGKVKVKPGKGILSPFVFTLNPKHKRITGLHGYGVHETNGYYFIDLHIGQCDYFTGKILREEKNDEGEYIVLELYSKDLEKTHFVAREHVWIEKNEMMLKKFMLYNSDGMLIHSTEYKDILLNEGLKNELFEKITINN